MLEIKTYQLVILLRDSLQVGNSGQLSHGLGHHLGLFLPSLQVAEQAGMVELLNGPGTGATLVLWAQGKRGGERRGTGSTLILGSCASRLLLCVCAAPALSTSQALLLGQASERQQGLGK